MPCVWAIAWQNESTKAELNSQKEKFTMKIPIHTITTFLGAAGGTIAGTALGRAVGGQLGATVGGVAGAIAGGIAGHTLAELAHKQAMKCKQRCS